MPHLCQGKVPDLPTHHLDPAALLLYDYQSTNTKETTTMSNDNAVTIVGTLTRDPELRYTPSGATVVTFGIARNTRRKEGDEWVDGDPQFYDVKAWNSLAENIAESLTKGTRVVIFGELEYRTWETDGGDKRSKIEIKAEAIGPDLRWATAQVRKVQSGSGNSGSSGGQKRQAHPDEDPFA